MKEFNKEALTVEEQLNLLIKRGLIVEDYISAIKILKRIGYYHLSSYMRYFQTGEDHLFIKNTKFSQIINLYNFDKELRHLTFNAIEKIEIAYRAAISNIMCKEFNSHWFEDISAFSSKAEQINCIELIKYEIEKKKKKDNNSRNSENFNNRFAETFIAKYYEKYSEPDLPPFWMAVETFSIGSLHRMYWSLKDDYKKKIIKYLDFKNDVTFIALYSNWLQPLCMVRNLCAHHSRLYNRIFKIKAKQHKKIKEFSIAPNNKFYYIAMIINYYLITISQDNSFEEDLIKLFNKYLDVDKKQMGFPAEWTNFSITPIVNKVTISH